MFELTDFYQYCKTHKVDVIPLMGIPRLGATIRDGADYAVFLDSAGLDTQRLLRGVCCHELGHLATGSLHKVDSPYESSGRSEYRASRWMAENCLPCEEFRQAFAAGYTEPWQLAEYFDMPEQDILTALSYWIHRKGINFEE